MDKTIFLNQSSQWHCHCITLKHMGPISANAFSSVCQDGTIYTSVLFMSSVLLRSHNIFSLFLLQVISSCELPKLVLGQTNVTSLYACFACYYCIFPTFMQWCPWYKHTYSVKMRVLQHISWGFANDLYLLVRIITHQWYILRDLILLYYL